MTISILGCGWYGMAIALELIKQGYTVKGSTTSMEKMSALSAAGVNPYLLQINWNDVIPETEFFECDVLIISIPPGLRKGNTTEYLPKIENVKKAILQYNITRVIYISSTGVYGDHNSEVNELNDPAPVTEAGQILLTAERLLQQQSAFKTTILRFGGLVGPGRHP
ncbi:MAG: NAD(P)H-binding protein, partial [Mucilaginibacter sp.]